MKFLEKDLEQIIFETSNRELRIRGLTIFGKKYRQLRIGKYGITDIISISRPIFTPSDGVYNGCHERLVITVLELKKENVSISTFLQAVRYCKGIESYIKDFRGSKIKIGFNIKLIGLKISKSDMIYLESFLYSHNFNLEFYKYSYNVDGLKFFNEKNYKLIDEGFTL